MSKVFIRPRARQDLLAIWSSCAERSRSAADTLIITLSERFEMLATHLQVGQLRPELNLSALRSFVSTPYVIFYVPIEDGVDIVRVLHGRMDTLRAWDTGDEDV